jgi:hypothetical protein
MRATVRRDLYSKEITHRPFKELGTRLAKQMQKVLFGVGMFRRKNIITEDEYEIVRRVAIATAPSRLEVIVRKMYFSGAERAWTVDKMSRIIGLPTVTTLRMIENLMLLGMLKRHQGAQTEYIFRDEILLLMEVSEVYKGSLINHKTGVNNGSAQTH